MRDDLRPSEGEYLNCIRCGLCLAVCPTYRQHLDEAASPRGRVALARKALQGDLPLSDNLSAHMLACFECQACDEICPVGIQPAALTLAMRDLQEHRQPSRWKKSLFGGLVHHPPRLETATAPLRLYERSGLRRLAYALGLPRLLPGRLQDMEAMLPRLPQRPLRRVLPQVSPSRGEERQRVGFFLGCAQSLLFAAESAASVRVLNRNGCTVISPSGVVCCGMPARGYGRRDLVLDAARTNIACFEAADVEQVITDCATCGSMLKQYASLLADDPAWAERARRFSSRVRDISEFLADLPLEKPAGRLDGRVTYHDPCHLRRAQGVWKQPRQLLQRIDGLQFIELPEADWCCGSAGSQLITHYETSLGVLGRKVDNLSTLNADYIASGCPACQMQLTLGVKRHGLKAQVVHPVTLLDMAYRLGDAGRGSSKENAAAIERDLVRQDG